jgi:hypothetical protein
MRHPKVAGISVGVAIVLEVCVWLVATHGGFETASIFASWHVIPILAVIALSRFFSSIDNGTAFWCSVIIAQVVLVSTVLYVVIRVIQSLGSKRRSE